MKVDNMSIVEWAYEIASDAHKDQKRNDGKTPYMKHINDVWRGIKELIEKSKNKHIDNPDDLVFQTFERGYYNSGLKYRDYYDVVQAVAIMHDVLEDQPDKYPLEKIDRMLLEDNITPDNVKRAFRSGLIAMTKNPDKTKESYLQYLERVKNDTAARIVKIIDLSMNSADLGPGNMKDKYALAKHYLLLKEFVYETV